MLKFYIFINLRLPEPPTNKECSRKFKYFFTLLFLLGMFWGKLGSFDAQAQSIPPDTSKIQKITSKYRQFGDFTFKKNIRTVTLTNPDWELSYPVLALNSGQQLKLSFDELSPESHVYYYRILHVNSSWNARDAMFSEYAEGFEDNEIVEYEGSYSSITPYHHYELLFPNDDIQLKISGNYVIEVYDESRENKVLSRRFVVYQNSATVQGEVRRAMSKNNGNTSHQIPFTVNLNGLKVNDPYSEIVIAILPNNNWHRAHTDFQPLFIKGDKLIYKDKPANIFEAGNEYRTLNIKDLTYEAVMVKSIRKINSDYHVKLRPDQSRRYIRYHDHQDLNGQFYIEKSNSMTPELDADYVNVYFTLQVENPILSGQVFVYGGWADYTFSGQNAMSYNARKKQYELRTRLKQGFYDYQYVVLSAYQNYEPDFSRLEGNHWETRNDYLVYVYLKDLVKGYHRVVGFKTLRTRF